MGLASLWLPLEAEAAVGRSSAGEERRHARADQLGRAVDVPTRRGGQAGHLQEFAFSMSDFSFTLLVLK